jgi:DNA-binding MarR family transcriptional regulator
MKKIWTGGGDFTPYRPWSDERKQKRRDRAAIRAAIELSRMILEFLDHGGSYTAEEIHGMLMPHPRGLWETLTKFERDGLIWRAFDYEDWRTLHKWKITGCGRLTIALTLGA